MLATDRLWSSAERVATRRDKSVVSILDESSSEVSRETLVIAESSSDCSLELAKLNDVVRLSIFDDFYVRSSI